MATAHLRHGDRRFCLKSHRVVDIATSQRYSYPEEVLTVL